MRTWRRSALRFVPPLALLLAAAAPLACFKPAVVDGGLKCNMTAGAKRCPDGFTCDSGDGFCKRHPSDGGVDKMPVSDASDAPEVGDVPSDQGQDCFQPVAGCTPGTGMCDPACQSGCNGCRDKCSINTAGTLTCNQPRMAGYPKAVMEACSIDSLGLAGQTDNCGQGLVCIQDSCFSRCFKFCKGDGDCTNSTCSRDVVSPDGGATGQKVCDVPFVDSCVPLASNQNTGCGPTTGTMSCYISSSSPAHTICDCPMGASGPNGPCNRSRECNRGLACVDLGPPNPICLQACRLNLDAGNDCSNGQVCHPYLGVPRGTVSNPNFGYCL